MNTSITPKVTVLMTVYNAAKYLHESIGSVLSQEYRDFEFLIINDGSIDGSVAIIRSYDDSRIRFINLESSIGQNAALNMGIDLARGKYIARMDCDDICHCERLAKQVRFMDDHPSVGVCGSWMEVFDERSNNTWRYPASSTDIKCHMFFECAIGHPSAIMRRELFLNNRLYYDDEFTHAADYELWDRAIELFEFANLQEILVRYRLTHDQLSSRYKAEQEHNASRVHEKQLFRLGLIPSAEERKLHNYITWMNIPPAQDFLKSVEMWFAKIIEANVKAKVYNQARLLKEIRNKWYELCYFLACKGINTWEIYCHSTMAKNDGISLKSRVKLFIRPYYFMYNSSCQKLYGLLNSHRRSIT